MRGLLLLLNALLLLESTDGNEEYDKLSQHEKNIIDRAIKAVNERYGRNKHIDFDSILITDSKKRMINVLLKPTSCDKTRPFVHRKDCEIQNQTPQVSCVECRGSMSCFSLREQEKIKQTVSECLHSPPRSNNHVLLQDGKGEQLDVWMLLRNKNGQGSLQLFI
ncbi:hypothetical protein ABG768_007226 [Culter alburnus]|uniref:Uncharacterized protein n=1 Tax=Culter alburnus TaxID=194366 RepID=A0AAW1ZN04_CULAL